MSTTIDESRTAVTLINTFDVEPHKQDELVELLERAAVEVFQYLDGFISSNIHRGLDGKHVAAYAQWARREDTSPSLAAHSPWRRGADFRSAFPQLTPCSWESQRTHSPAS